ncbi:MAG: hypothetical protein F4X60_13220 [Gemmatimonadetes bacterium]|nr:hypothetical protein [Gemmatimonadota bacterium]MYB99497.1 hypothetical protein [Gemmatimonadota bacterium]
MTRTLPILPLAALGLATACADPQIEPTELIPTTLEVSPQSLDFDALFATARLEATVFDQNGEVMTGAVVLWQSSSFEVARVDQGGLVTAVDNGSAYIVAAAGEATDSAQVGVQQRPHSVRITPPRRRTLTAIEDTVRLSASVLDPNGRPIAGAPVSWSSGDTTIVTVDEAGLVTSVATGTAFIRAALDNLADSVVTEVRQVPARVQILPADTLFAFGTLGDTLRLSAEVVDANGHPIPGLSVSWSTTSVLVAEIDREGLLTATGNGIAIITATALSARGSTRVQVEQVPASISVEAPIDLFAMGDSLRMMAEALDSGGSLISNAAFMWTSSDTSVVTVTPTGWAHAVGVGTAEITATLQHLSASAPVTTMNRDEFALRAFYRSTNGPLWAVNINWDTDAPLSEWFGVELNERGRVRSITLTKNILTGTIPPEISKLTELEELHLEENLLEGPLPPETGKLKSLVWLGLYDNYLEGPIPPEIGEIEVLEVLDLSYNLFTGSIPREVIDLPYLEYLGLFGNQLSGSIPREIGDFRSLKVLDLGANRLTGPIPPEIGNLRDLVSLGLSGIDHDSEAGNRLTGPIPPEIGKLSNLRQLNLGANRLEGPIPPEFGQLENLDSLWLYSNLLTSIPPELGNLTNLEYLSIYGNRLTGPIPSEIGNLEKLELLLLGWGYYSGNDNNLTGIIPPEFGNLVNLYKLDVGANNLTGIIPSELGRLTKLEFLELGSNELAGEIPPELGNLTRLSWLYSCPNNLTGPIPPEIGKMRGLTRLYICSNELTDTLPHALGKLTELRHLHLGGNRLTGPFPTTMLALTRLEVFFWHVRNTGLCAPDTKPFREWLAGIPNHSGIFCGSDAYADIQARAIVNCSVTEAAARSATGRMLAERRRGEWRAPAGLRLRAGRGVAETPGTWQVPCGRSLGGAPNW